MLSRASVPKQAIITQLAGVRTPDLESFARQLASLAHGAQVPLQYFVFGERHHRRTAILHIDRSWSAPLTPAFTPHTLRKCSSHQVHTEFPAHALISFLLPSAQPILLVEQFPWCGPAWLTLGIHPYSSTIGCLILEAISNVTFELYKV